MYSNIFPVCKLQQCLSHLLYQKGPMLTKGLDVSHLNANKHCLMFKRDSNRWGLKDRRITGAPVGLINVKASKILAYRCMPKYSSGHAGHESWRLPFDGQTTTYLQRSTTALECCLWHPSC